MQHLDEHCNGCEQCDPRPHPVLLSNKTIRQIRELCVNAQVLGFTLFATEQGIKIEHKRKSHRWVILCPDTEHVETFLKGVQAGRATAQEEDA